MAYVEDADDTVVAQLTTVEGTTMDLQLSSNCTVGELISFLVQENGYPPESCLTFNGRPVSSDQLIRDYPYGRLVLDYPMPGQSRRGSRATSRADHTERNRNADHSNDARSQAKKDDEGTTTSPSKGKVPRRRSEPTPKKNAVEPTPAATPPAPPQNSPPPQQTPPPPPTQLDTPAHWQEVVFTVTCVVPSLEKEIKLELTADVSVADLLLTILSVCPQLGSSATVVYKGKTLSATTDNKLFNCGMRSDCTVYVAAGTYGNPEIIVLLEIEAAVNRIEAAKNGPLTDVERKGYYEELMRLLLQTDGLQTLEGVWKQKRRDTVKRITALQDQIHRPQ
ncbi:BAG domain containing protein, putative [Angomonas deanei]|uniref:BAG domain containing protein, putative n=1 Tax=Angomonas deanei TaxID=59799 RepID=A0A7G2CEK7_9TRYP|nr:BAG domain containing protein, putative [Angomonas deanei]